MKRNDMTTTYEVNQTNQQQANQPCGVCQHVCTCQDPTSKNQLGVNYFGVGRSSDDYEF